MSAGLEGYPFGELTERYSYRAEVGSNWKLFIDAFQEFYHAPVLHVKQSPVAAIPSMEARLRGHSTTRSTARTAWCRRRAARWAMPAEWVKPIETAVPQRPVRPVGQARPRRAAALG